MRYHLVTLGCPKNVADSDKLEALLREGYHEPTDRPARADLIVVNTCGFLEAAREESVDAILRLALRKRPGQKLVVAGCLSQICARQLQEEIPEVDALFGVEAWEQVAALAGTAARPRHARPCGHGGALRYPGDLPEPAAQRLPEDLRRLQRPLRLLHHPPHQGAPPQRRARGPGG